MKIILIDAVHTLVIPGEGIVRELHELLESYPNQKVIVTNADDVQMELFGLNHMPYSVFTLKHNPEKSDPLYFELLLKNLGINANQVVYIEHNREAIASAVSLGILCHHYDEKFKDLPALKNFLKSNL